MYCLTKGSEILSKCDQKRCPIFIRFETYHNCLHSLYVNSRKQKFNVFETSAILGIDKHKVKAIYEKFCFGLIDAEIRRVIDTNREAVGNKTIKDKKDKCLVCGRPSRFFFKQDCFPDCSYCSIRCYYKKLPSIVNFETRYDVSFDSFQKCSGRKLANLVRQGINFG